MTNREAATQLRELADAIDGALGDEGNEGAGWPESLREIADQLEGMDVSALLQSERKKDRERLEVLGGGILTDSHRT